MEKDYLFKTMQPAKALAVMALPTIASQMIILIYNLADTWFIGRTNDPYMIAASSLGLTVYLAATALANVFGVGGGSLMARLTGENRTDDARRVVAHSISAALISAFVFSLLTAIFMSPLLQALGAGENTLVYTKQYVLTTAVIGGVPTVLSMCMPQLLRNAGYAREAGIGVGLGSICNIVLDPLFMFVLLPKGNEVLGAGTATMLSSVLSMGYFIVIYRKLRDKTVLMLPRRPERLEGELLRSLYSVGIPAAVSIFFFDLVTMVINRLAALYGDIPLAAMGIVLKLERIPINIGLGICLGMVPLIAYNYGSGDRARMQQISALARIVIVGFACLCAVLFWILAGPLIGVFIADEETIQAGTGFLRGRCFSLPFMMAGYHIVNYMNAVNRGKISFVLAILRHVVLIIPVMLLMNRVWGLNGLTWSQLVADALNILIASMIFRYVNNRICLPESCCKG